MDRPGIIHKNPLRDLGAKEAVLVREYDPRRGKLPVPFCLAMDGPLACWRTPKHSDEHWTVTTVDGRRYEAVWPNHGGVRPIDPERGWLDRPAHA